MSLKQEFVCLARQPGINIRDLCRRFDISPQTGYKWLKRYEEHGESGLCDRSRRPHNSPKQAEARLAAEVVAVRREHPAWGGRKISRVLDKRIAPSTVTNVLHRHDLITPQASEAARQWTRFEHAAPNDLWQMDFKGDFQTLQGRCYPLTIIDDHSRFNLAIQGCACQRGALVQEHLSEVFRRYGLPARINTDNGAPWGAPRHPGELTPLGIWLVTLGIRLSFSRPGHPQTNGKDERFHRSLKAEVLKGRIYRNLEEAQSAFDHWREIYNFLRPHDALDLEVPMSRYQVSSHAFPASLPQIEYGPEDILVKPYDSQFRFKKRSFRIAKALGGHIVALRPSTKGNDLFDVYFGHQRVRTIDFNNPDGKG